MQELPNEIAVKCFIVEIWLMMSELVMKRFLDRNIFHSLILSDRFSSSLLSKLKDFEVPREFNHYDNKISPIYSTNSAKLYSEKARFQRPVIRTNAVRWNGWIDKQVNKLIHISIRLTIGKFYKTITQLNIVYLKHYALNNVFRL